MECYIKTNYFEWFKYSIKQNSTNKHKKQQLNAPPPPSPPKQPQNLSSFSRNVFHESKMGLCARKLKVMDGGEFCVWRKIYYMWRPHVCHFISRSGNKCGDFLIPSTIFCHLLGPTVLERWWQGWIASPKVPERSWPLQD